MRVSLRRLFKTGICVLFAVIISVSGPAQIIAVAMEDQVYEGVNEYALESETPLTEEELDSLLEELKEPYTDNLEEPTEEPTEAPMLLQSLASAANFLLIGASSNPSS